MNRMSVVAAVAAALSVAAATAFAQSAESTEAPEIVAQATPSDRATQQRGASEQRAVRMPSERLEERLSRVRAALQITDAQQAQWDQFANVLRTHAREMDQRIQSRMAQRDQAGQRPERPQTSAIERLERQQQRLAQRTERLNEVVAAARPLYAAFTPEQQQIADKMLARDGQRRGPHGGGHHRHRGMHHGA
jgi:periplasmic protein CpxP/Spy